MLQVNPISAAFILTAFCIIAVWGWYVLSKDDEEKPKKSIKRKSR